MLVTEHGEGDVNVHESVELKAAVAVAGGNGKGHQLPVPFAVWQCLTVIAQTDQSIRA